ncbi:hypothetical protein Kisp01_26790 [Kineosporia sp. NBRC 101677]|nr:hypothetical protein Kisp01_26790 [Kineosporia sp. NBRC 101677]
MGAVLSLTAACSSASGTPRGQGMTTPAPTVQKDSDEPPGLGDVWTKQDVVEMYERDKGLRLKLPVTLPEGYEFTGFVPPDVRPTKKGEKIIARKAWFRLNHETAMVCVELTRADAGICPETNIDVSSTEKGQLLQVSVEVPVSNDTLDWGDVRYSADPADWTWLP